MQAPRPCSRSGSQGSPRSQRAIVISLQVLGIGLEIGLAGSEGKHRIQYTDKAPEVLPGDAAVLKAVTDDIPKHSSPRFVPETAVIAHQVQRPPLARNTLFRTAP